MARKMSEKHVRFDFNNEKTGNNCDEDDILRPKNSCRNNDYNVPLPSFKLFNATKRKSKLVSKLMRHNGSVWYRTHGTIQTACKIIRWLVLAYFGRYIM